MSEVGGTNTIREVEINLEGIGSIEEFHNLVREKLNFPDYYGKNLDAMHDCLTDIAEPMEVVFTGVKKFREKSQDNDIYMTSLERMLEDVSKEAENLTFILLAEDDEDMEEPKTKSTGSSYIHTGSDEESILNALKSLGIGEGDAVLHSAFAGRGVINGIKNSGATGIPIDIAPENYGMEGRLIDFAITGLKNRDGITPRAIIASQIFGIPQNMSLIDVVSNDCGLSIIIEGEEEIPDNDRDYLSRIGEAYKLALQLRFGKGSTRLWSTKIPKDVKPAWKGFPVRFADPKKRDEASEYLANNEIKAELPSLGLLPEEMEHIPVAKKVAESTLILPTGVDMEAKDIVRVVDGIWEFFGKPEPEEDMNPFSAISDAHPEYGTR